MNWIVHMDALRVNNWLTIVEDQKSMEFLEEHYPGHVVPASVFTDEALSSGNALYEYGTAAFTQIACARPHYLQVQLCLPGHVSGDKGAHAMCNNISCNW